MTQKKSTMMTAKIYVAYNILRENKDIIYS